MKLYQILGIGAIGLVSLLGCSDNETKLYSKPIEQWVRKETNYGINFIKKINGKEILYYTNYFKGDPYLIEEPSIAITTEYATGYTIIWDCSCNGNVLDGNINKIYMFDDTIPFSGSIMFDDKGNVVKKIDDYAKYSDESFLILLDWANQKFKEVQEETRKVFGNKIEIPKDRKFEPKVKYRF